MSSVVLLLLLVPQDLIDREVSLRRRLSPSVDFSGVKPLRASVELDALPDYACGSFDPRSSFKALFDRNVKEEFLGTALQAVRSELAGSALVLACYASPTVCDAIKHYRVTANTMLGMEFDMCRSVEQALDDVQRRSRAREIKECLDEKARQGMPLDEAQRECRRAASRRKETDLLGELGIPEALNQPIRLGPAKLKVESRATAVAEAYESKRRECLAAWEGALRDPEKATLDRLGPVTRGEVERISLMDPARREAVVRSAASAAALSELVKQAHEAERALESGELTAPPEVRDELERRRLQLRGEVSRLTESFEMERRLNAALAEAQAAAEADVARKAREHLAPRRAAEAGRAALESARPGGCEVKR